MIVVAVMLGAALLAGVIAVGVATRWPTIDPASPRVTTRLARWELRSHPEFVQARFDPRVATGLALTVAAVAVVIGLTVFVVVAVMVATASGLELADRPIERWVNDHATAFSTDVLEAVTDLGATLPVIVLALVVAAVELVRARSKAIVPFLVVVIGGQSLVVLALKAIADRARPEINPLAENLGPSFPSGHTATAAACLAALALLLGRRRSRVVQIALVGVAVGLAVAVASTRVLLGVHFLTDAIAGLAVGWAWFAVSAIAFGGRLLVFGAPVEVAERVEHLRATQDTPAPESHALSPPSHGG